VRGRLDPAGATLGRVLAPTLLSSTPSTAGARAKPAPPAAAGAEMRLEAMLGAGRLSEEPGPLVRVAELAVGLVHAPARHLTSWFPAPVRW
jgi:hypothetical protein